MIKKLILIISLALITPLCYASNGVLVSHNSLIPDDITNPSELSSWLQNNFSYQDDDIDHWKTPQEFLIDKGGDCEDYAIFIKEVLKQWNIQAELWIMVKIQKDGSRMGHMIAVYETPHKTYNIFDNDYLFITRTNDRKELLDKYYPSWIRSAKAIGVKGYYYSWIFKN